MQSEDTLPSSQGGLSGSYPLPDEFSALTSSMAWVTRSLLEIKYEFQTRGSFINDGLLIIETEWPIYNRNIECFFESDLHYLLFSTIFYLFGS
jgi:hypothetical protein